MSPRPPLDLDRSAAAGEAAHELSRSVYHAGATTLAHDALQVLQRALGRLLAGASGHSGPVGVLLAAVAVVLILLLIVGLRRIGPPRRRFAAVPAEPPTRTPEPTAAALRATAGAAAAAGDWREAVLAGFRATALELVDAGVVAGTPGLTAAELVEAAAPALPSAAADLRVAATVFGAVSYGNVAAGPTAGATVAAADSAVRRDLAARRRSHPARVRVPA